MVCGHVLHPNALGVDGPGKERAEDESSVAEPCNGALAIGVGERNVDVGHFRPVLKGVGEIGDRDPCVEVGADADGRDSGQMIVVRGDTVAGSSCRSVLTGDPGLG